MQKVVMEPTKRLVYECIIIVVSCYDIVCMAYVGICTSLEMGRN